MTPAAVGLRCPDHAGGARRVRRPAFVVPQRRIGIGSSTFAPVTRALIAVNLAVYLITVVQGSGINSPGGRLFAKMLLFGPAVKNGDWWRLVTAMFLHANLIHIGFNMFALWVIGAPVEHFLGRARYLGLYFAAGLAGSAGALLQAPYAPTVGASGAIFGILGALLILEYQATGRLAGQAMTLIAINLVFSFSFSGISWGGHVGGLIGGILVTLAYARFGRERAAHGGLGLGGAVGLLLVGAGSVAVAYLQVRGLA